ncbi:TonB-dependent receptor domain-containing protein [Novosphingobium resinovorum]|uniref:TonB-dependent receptor domain-containing protein n=1 Tax=Novosphingobium resinovorum TaxID=158500 RepID=UPI002ECFD402|nr:TonB-dependent receptor [Novosphingobium resinovorum]
MPYMQAPKMRRPTLHAILAGCALLAFTAGSPTASAQTVPREAETTRAFDITAKPLANAIMQFTEQSGIPVAYPAALGAGKRSAAVKGRFHPLEALSRLLVETGLAARMTPAGVTLEARATAAANAAEPAQIGSVTVTSTALERSATTGNTRSYSTDQVSIDRLSSSLRDIPQAVTVITREQLDALNLNSVNDAIALQSGAIVIQNDGTNERAEIMFRGFLADSLRVDGGAVSGNNDVTTFDAAIFDRIEILRGPAGILQGAGDPGGTINLVRNRATDTRSVNAEAQVGSWDQLRGVVDIGGPITAQGGVRARAIALINKSDSFVDLTNSRRFTLFGTVDLDVTPDTTVTVGGTWQEAEGRNGRGLPGYADGTIPDVARSTFIGARWNHNKTRSADIFANLEHRLPGGAVFRLTTSYLDRSRHGKLAFPDSAVDPATGETLLENEYRIDTEENLNLDANLRVPFDLGGLEHALLIGADYRRINEARRAAAGGYVAQNVFSPDHDIAEPDWIFEEFLATRTEQLGTYAQARIKPVSWATFVTGGRMTWWKARAYEGVADELVGVTKVDGKFTPYAAALADLNGFLTAYASYTSIFVPQDDVTIENEAVAPRVGRQFEIGVRVALPAFERIGKGAAYGRIDIRLPEDNRTVRIEAMPRDARHEGMSDEIDIDALNGKVTRSDFYADRPAGRIVTSSMFMLHSGQFFGLPGRILLFLASAAMPLFTVTGFLLYLARRRKARMPRASTLPTAGPTDTGTVIAFASQSGSAERIARQTLASLPGARLLRMGGLSQDVLAGTRRLLLVASTYGEGEAPDMARTFVRKAMATRPDLQHLDYSVLALGDREYRHFCAFGHALDVWLDACGARRSIPLIEADGEDAASLETWRLYLAGLGARPVGAAWEPEPWQRWRLVERRLLNPGSQGGPMFHLSFAPCHAGALKWLAGDIAEILPRRESAKAQDETEAPALRAYSIASVAASGHLDLLVRQVRKDNGLYGIGSGWLTNWAKLGDEIDLRIRVNASFHAHEDANRPLVLIGSGSGLAGLICHVRQRSRQGGAPVWLIHGERNRMHDRFHDEELSSLRASGTIARIDWCWSRDTDSKRYVQDAVTAAAADLERWVSHGSAIYVCGNAKGMAPEVDKAIRGAIGDTLTDRLIDQGLYRRDVF